MARPAQPYLAILIAVVATGPAEAAVRDWASPLCAASLFSSTSCWSSGIVPGSLDVASFNTRSSTPYTVTFSSGVTTQHAWVPNDDVTWDLNGSSYNFTRVPTYITPSLAVGRLFGDFGRLRIVDGVVNSLYTDIGVQAGSTGSLTVDAGATLNEDQRIAVGNLGAGTLNIQDGGHASTQLFYLGSEVGSNGTAVVDGSGSQLITGQNFVGLHGDGALTVRNGAKLFSADLDIGYAAGTHGSVTLEGPGTSAPNGTNVFAGDYGNGILRILDGATIGLSNSISVARRAGSTGAVTVSGSGSRLTLYDKLRVGDFGQGKLDIAAGGFVSSADSASIGDNTGSSGRVTVDGIGSRWESYATAVGNEGNGSLVVTNGGSVLTYNSGSVGGGPGSGSAVVDGDGSSWTQVSRLVVGATSGTGSLLIANGGKVASGDEAWVGISGGPGQVTVDGKDSLWITGGEANIGGNRYTAGTGALKISNGAVVADSFGFTAQRVGATAEVTVSGAGSRWSHGNALHVAGGASGAGGTAQVTVSSGGTITAGDMIEVWKGGSVRLDEGVIDARVLDLAGGKLSGNGLINGSLQSHGGQLSPGLSIGRIGITGNFEQDSLGIFLAELAGFDGSTGYDRLDIGGEAILDGALRVDFLNGFSPAAGDNFDLLFAAVLHGQFSTLDLPQLQAGLQWQPLYLLDEANPDVFRLSVTAVPAPGAFWLLMTGVATGPLLSRRRGVRPSA